MLLKGNPGAFPHTCIPYIIRLWQSISSGMFSVQQTTAEVSRLYLHRFPDHHFTVFNCKRDAQLSKGNSMHHGPLSVPTASIQEFQRTVEVHRRIMSHPTSSTKWKAPVTNQNPRRRAGRKKKMMMMKAQ